MFIKVTVYIFYNIQKHINKLEKYVWMETHHHIRDLNSRIQCMYCNKDLSKLDGWESEHCSGIHYKKNRCECGKEARIRVHVDGSGHDFWDGTQSWENEEEGEEKSIDDVL